MLSLKIIDLMVLEKNIYFAIYSHGGHFGHVTWTIFINLRSPFVRMLHMKFGFDWPSGFRGEELWTSHDDDDDGRTTEHGHHISSHCEPSAHVS